MKKDLSKLSLNELKALKIEKEQELSQIEDAIEFQKTMEKPYCYSISSYRQSPKGKCKNLKEVEGVMSKYFTQERIGSGLITGGHSYKVHTDKKEELLSFMFSAQNSNQLLQVVAKILLKKAEVKEGMTNAILFESISEDLPKSQSAMEFRDTRNFQEALCLLGKLLDEDNEGTISKIGMSGLRLGKYILKNKGHKFIFLYNDISN